MLILHRQRTAISGNKWEIIAIFGVGLIGQAVINELLVLQDFIVCYLPYSWGCPERQLEEGRSIVRYIRQQVAYFHERELTASDGKITILWSAGRGGFGSSWAELITEMNSFGYVANIAMELLNAFPDAYHSFHMVSSGGGLFEGQRCIDSETEPHPLRPYGELKLKQEKYASEHISSIPKYIYRPSSVYGFNKMGNRMGLIPTLIRNGIHQCVSNIFAGMNTLRDYVFSADIGRFIAITILGEVITQRTAIFTLASGRASTIYEVKSHVQQIIRRDIYIQYQTGWATDSGDNTYRISALPQGWVAISIQDGIRRVYLELLGF